MGILPPQNPQTLVYGDPIMDLSFQNHASEIDRQSDSLKLIAHEIKAPIAVVIQLLQAAELSLHQPGLENPLRLVQKAIKRARSALDLTRNLLDYIRIGEATQDMKKTTDVIFAEHLPGLLEKHQAAAQSHDFRVICEFNPQRTPLSVRVFEFDLIVDNLVSNAIRYSKRNQGPQQVWIRTFELPDSFVLEIQDEGIGMSEADQGKLFSSFHRSSEAKDQTISGTGLGMALVKKITDDLGAEISCRSIPGTGTVFRVSFPKPADR